MRPDDLPERLIAAARRAGADAADALAVSSAALSVGVRDGALEQAERSESVDFGLRAFVGARQACVSASDPRPEVIEDLARRAVAMAREAPEDPWCGLLPAAETGAAEADLALDDPAGPPEPAALQALALRAEDAARGVAGIRAVESAEAGWSRRRVALATSNGFFGAYDRASAGLGVSAIAGEGVAMEADHAGESRPALAALPAPEEIGARAGRRAVERLGARKPPQGAAPVIFDARIAASLIRHLLAAANGAAVARGQSWLIDRMGEAVLPDWATLRENPLAPALPASRPFDGEGAPSRTAPLVENGRLTRWLLDAASARQLGLETTANARRGPGSPPSPGASNMTLSPGALSREALIAEAGTGLLVTAMMGLSLNPNTGAYSRGASGFWIENGEIAYPVSEATIAGALPDALRGMVAANDPEPHRALSVPSLLVHGFTIA